MEESLDTYQKRLGGKIVLIFRRAIAFGYDAVFKAILIYILLKYVLYNTFLISSPLFFAFLFSMLYEVLFTSTDLKATPGKLIADIRVVNKHGNRLSVLRALLRYLTRFISIFTGLGIFYAIGDEKKRTWHDKLSSTFVIEPIMFHDQEEILDQELN